MMNRILSILIAWGVFQIGLSQIHIQLTLPQNIEQCLGLPVEILISNEGRAPLLNADIQLHLSDHFKYKPPKNFGC
ncbi:MAG: hypothetical protein IPM34_04135 [Saprospiraceae bacterium]|nr:hypothetical protein [Saprospiraceae bacterium]